MDKEAVVASAVEFAAQTGRLDFVSALLATIALLLALGAFPVFYYVQRRAEAVALAEAQKVLDGAEDRIEAAAISKVEEMLPNLYEEYVAMAQRAASDATANAIAAAQEGEDGHAN